ncbi:MAG: nucleoid-associated protein [Bacteroidota bacterium]
MVSLREAELKALAVHRVGNKVKNEGYTASNTLFEVDELMVGILHDYFLSPFKTEEFFKFSHESDLGMNEVYAYSRNIFEAIATGGLLENSVHILKHLYDVSSHPQIKSGELFVAYFKSCYLEDQEMDAIGIFKAEHKDTFLAFDEQVDNVDMSALQGVNTRKLDKGCMIFNSYADDGYSVLMIDRASEDTRYWREDFLGLERIQDNSFQTESFLNMTRDFCTEVVAQEKDTADQLLFMNKSINFFAQNEDFDLNSYQNEVIENPTLIEQFSEYKKPYEEEQGLNYGDGFTISKFAVRNKKREFKNLIKLDNQIEINLKSKDLEYIRQYIEKGFDHEKGLSYYKIYFNQEMDF